MPNYQGLAMRAYNGAHKLITRSILELSRFDNEGLELRGIGNGEGQWMVPMARLRPGAICYCVGVGMDASMDVALANEGMKVFSFDPTPHSIEYMKRIDCERLTFLPYGIWKQTETVKFFAPMNPLHPNFSTRDI